MRALLAAHMAVHRINPFKLRQFAKASGILAKSGRLDARVIASFIAIMPTRRAQRHSLAIEGLTEMLTVRREIMDEKIAPRMPPRWPEDAILLAAPRRRIGRLAVEIMRTAAALVHRYRLLTSMPGVGPSDGCWTSIVPEFGSMSGKQVAALVGVTP
jgi:transposase